MITEIFYSRILFPRVQYKKSFSGYELLSLHERDYGTIEGIFRNKEHQNVHLLFTYKDFTTKLLDTKDWLIETGDEFLRQHIKEVILSHEKDFLFFKDKDFYDAIPFGTVLTITSKCNLFCNYCFNDYDYPLVGRNQRPNIGLDQYKKIVDILYAAGTRDIIITGGEPFSAPFLWDLLDYIRDTGIFIRINTNGTLLTDTILERLNTNYSLNLMVSMHEFNNEDYYAINAEGARNFGGQNELHGFENKFEKKVIQLKKVVNFPNLSLDFLTILRPKNIIFLEKLYDFVLSNFRIKNWHFFRLYSTGTTKGISRTLIKIAIHKIFALNKKYKTNFKFVDSVPFCATDNLEKAASVIEGELSDRHNVKTIITTDGYIQIMSAFDSNLGSIFEHDILEVWRGDFVQNMLKNGFLPEECQNCAYKETCRGGSRMDAHIFHGSYSAFDPLGDIHNKICK